VSHIAVDLDDCVLDFCGGLRAADRLRRQGHYLECITSKPPWAEHNVYKWLGKWRPPFQRVTIVGQDDVKADFTDADLLIDDRVENCNGFRREDRQAILFGRPHNAKVVRGATIWRAEGWPEVLEMVGVLTT